MIDSGQCDSTIQNEKGKGKRKEKGKGKWKDNERKTAANIDAEVICHYSHRTRTWEAKKGQPVKAVDQALGQGAAASSTQVTTPRISMVETDDWILMALSAAIPMCDFVKCCMFVCGVKTFWKVTRAILL